MKNRWLNFWEAFLNTCFGEKCAHCGKRSTVRSYEYTRGWNEHCQQAAGDSGIFCYNCTKVTWDTPYKKYVKQLPKWIRPYPNA